MEEVTTPGWLRPGRDPLTSNTVRQIEVCSEATNGVRRAAPWTRLTVREVENENATSQETSRTEA
jgi:hypothetical protein